MVSHWSRPECRRMRASLVSQSREAEPTDWLSNLAGRRAHRGGHGAPGCLAGGGRDVAGVGVVSQADHFRADHHHAGLGHRLAASERPRPVAAGPPRSIPARKRRAVQPRLTGTDRPGHGRCDTREDGSHPPTGGAAGPRQAARAPQSASCRSSAAPAPGGRAVRPYQALRVKESCDVRIAWQVDVSPPPIKMIGGGMIIMLLLDATVVRALLVPATMRLLGRYSWWAPRPLARLWDRYGHREHSEPTAARPPLVLEPPCLARHPSRAGACAAGRAQAAGVQVHAAAGAAFRSGTSVTPALAAGEEDSWPSAT